MKKAFTVRLPPDLVKDLRIIAIKEERSSNEVIKEAFTKYIVDRYPSVIIKEEKWPTNQ